MGVHAISHSICIGNKNKEIFKTLRHFINHVGSGGHGHGRVLLHGCGVACSGGGGGGPCPTTVAAATDDIESVVAVAAAFVFFTARDGAVAGLHAATAGFGRRLLLR